MAAREEARRRNAGPEDRDVDERCILGFNSGPPMLPGAYNNFVQVFQGPGHVAILNEMVHDVRLVPLDGRPALPQQIRQWKGDSRGRWEGDTLVIETANFMAIGTAHPAPNMERLEATGSHLVWSSGSGASMPRRCSTSSRWTIRPRGRCRGASS